MITVEDLALRTITTVMPYYFVAASLHHQPLLIRLLQSLNLIIETTTAFS
jgi:hypothetical protein